MSLIVSQNCWMKMRVAGDNGIMPLSCHCYDESVIRHLCHKVHYALSLILMIWSIQNFACHDNWAILACVKFWSDLIVIFSCTSVSIVCSTMCSGADQRKYQSLASLAFVRGIHRWMVDSRHKGPVTQKIYPFYVEYDFPSGSKVILKDMGKLDQYLTTQNIVK